MREKQKKQWNGALHRDFKQECEQKMLFKIRMLRK